MSIQSVSYNETDRLLVIYTKFHFYSYFGQVLDRLTAVEVNFSRLLHVWIIFFPGAFLCPFRWSRRHIWSTGSKVEDTSSSDTASSFPSGSQVRRIRPHLLLSLQRRYNCLIAFSCTEVMLCCVLEIIDLWILICLSMTEFCHLPILSLSLSSINVSLLSHQRLWRSFNFHSAVVFRCAFCCKWVFYLLDIFAVK